jgi:hypothetical protein
VLMLCFLTYLSSFIYRVTKTEEPADIKPVIKDVSIHISGLHGVICSLIPERALSPKRTLTWDATSRQKVVEM